MFLLIIDAYSKWMKVDNTGSSTSASTISLMRRAFSSFGLPEVIVSDNTTTLTSNKFLLFLKKNRLRLVRTPPFHPASNDLAERAIEIFKEGMRELNDGSLETRCQILCSSTYSPLKAALVYYQQNCCMDDNYVLNWIVYVQISVGKSGKIRSITKEDIMFTQSDMNSRLVTWCVQGTMDRDKHSCQEK